MYKHIKLIDKLCQFVSINLIMYFDISKYSLENQNCYSWFSLQPSIAVEAVGEQKPRTLDGIGVKYDNFGVEYQLQLCVYFRK